MLPFGLNSEDVPKLVNVVILTEAIVIGTLIAFACIPALPESDTIYKYMESKNIPANLNKAGFLALGSAQKIEGKYLVIIDDTLSPTMKNLILKHENCHVQQYKSKRNMTSDEREFECYIRMWLP